MSERRCECTLSLSGGRGAGGRHLQKKMVDGEQNKTGRRGGVEEVAEGAERYVGASGCVSIVLGYVPKLFHSLAPANFA